MPGFSEELARGESGSRKREDERDQVRPRSELTLCQENALSWDRSRFPLPVTGRSRHAGTLSARAVLFVAVLYKNPEPRRLEVLHGPAPPDTL
jgi:hypothetical protein